MEGPDIVLPVRVGAANEQLRYALRSMAENLPHRRVWVVGHRLAWLRHVDHIPTEQDGSKYQNTTAAVRAACEHPGVSGRFLLANDDFFVMHPVPVMPVLHRGPVREVEAYYATRASNGYLRGMRQTRDLLVQLGHPDPLSYELHVPLPVDKAQMLEALDVGARAGIDVLHKRTLYGGLAQIGGSRLVDVKVLNRSPRFPRSSVFLSTLPDSFANGQVGTFIRRRFPRPCRYEKTGSR
jgi:hypothetical protein